MTVREQAVQRLRKRSDFYRHLLVYAVVNGLAVLVWATTGDGGFFWPAILITLWGLGVVMHAWDVFRNDFSERRIQHEMERISRG